MSALISKAQLTLQDNPHPHHDSSPTPPGYLLTQAVPSHHLSHDLDNSCDAKDVAHQSIAAAEVLDAAARRSTEENRIMLEMAHYMSTNPWRNNAWFHLLLH